MLDLSEARNAYDLFHLNHKSQNANWCSSQTTQKPANVVSNSLSVKKIQKRSSKANVFRDTNQQSDSLYWQLTSIIMNRVCFITFLKNRHGSFVIAPCVIWKVWESCWLLMWSGLILPINVHSGSINLHLDHQNLLWDSNWDSTILHPTRNRMKIKMLNCSTHNTSYDFSLHIWQWDKKALVYN